AAGQQGGGRQENAVVAAEQLQDARPASGGGPDQAEDREVLPQTQADAQQEDEGEVELKEANEVEVPEPVHGGVAAGRRRRESFVRRRGGPVWYCPHFAAACPERPLDELSRKGNTGTNVPTAGAKDPPEPETMMGPGRPRLRRPPRDRSKFVARPSS